jgi:di/tricarboxylate transporter
MTLDIALLLAIVAAALVLFTIERFSPDIVALGTLVTLVLTGLLPLEEALAEFTSDAAVMILGLFVFTAALVHTGVVGIVERIVRRLAGDHSQRLAYVIAATAAVLSTLISNTATTAFLLPITLNLARKAEVRASRLLMPMAFAAILSSSVTLVSSSTNIVISGLMGAHGMPPLGLFELAPVGLPIVVTGLAYLWLLGQRLIPDRSEMESSLDTFSIQPYLVEAVVLPESPLAGQTLAASRLGRDLDLTVLRVFRDVNHYLAPRADLRLQEGDELLLKGERDEILRIRDSVGIAVKAEVKLSDPSLQVQELRMAEALLLPWSPLVGQSLKQLQFRQRLGLQVLGISRRGTNLYRKLSQVPLKTGDQLLVQGTPASIAAVDRQSLLRILGAVDHRRPDLDRAPAAIAVFGGTLAVTALNLLSLPLAILLGILMLFLTRCIAPDEAYQEINWKAVIVIGSMLAMGRAMERTGAAGFLAAQIAAISSHANPVVLLGAFFALALLLTQPMSNQAAAVVVVPVALETASRLGLNPRTFAIMIAVGASCSFITPLEPSCLIVYGPGRYRFLDFIRVGAALTLLIFFLAILLVPMIWPM